MSNFELKDGHFNLFKNTRKTEDKHPDYTGTIRLSGKDHFFDCWVNEGKKGKFLSGRIGKEKQPMDDKPVMDNTRAGGRVDLDDEVPF